MTISLDQPSHSSALVEVKGLTVTVNARRPYDIVRGVGLSLAAGEVLGIVGESGSGKTTTALALLGFARPGTVISGSVRIAGTEMVTASEADRRRARGSLVAYVPQDPSSSLNPALRIGAQLDEVLAWRRRDRRQVDKTRVTELLQKVKLPTTREFLRRYPHQLSGGQLQRICIAMAMLKRPRLIVFDEPTTGLDVTTQGHVLETIKELVGPEGAAAVYVTHDLAVVGSIAGRLGVMYSGLLVEEAPTPTVLCHSAHPYSKRLVLATPSVTRRRELHGIAGTPLNPRDRHAGCPFAARCEFAEERCWQVGPQVVEVSEGHRSRCLRAIEVQASQAAASLSGRPGWEEKVATTSPVLTLAGVYASYGSHTVINEVDISVGDGECLALVGESGSGKTTLARCISGIHPDGVEGYLGFDGRALEWPAKKRPREALREIQYIFQNPYASLNPRRTIGHLLMQPLETFGIGAGYAERRTRVAQLLQRVALPAEYENRYPSQLSGGERQRVAIARALAAQPRLMVCDEITSSLDVSIQASVLELLGKLRREENLTMLFITHNLGLVRAIADQVVILQGGRIVEKGPASSILDGPAEQYTFELLANTPVLAGPVGAGE
ncbi:MAG TPA: ABC transporter ATP-binding protein [Acidimicrobiales bacterium]|nr:ABC transporter ATP-binding protein [Acidimicrobiales bacterium]